MADESDTRNSSNLTAVMMAIIGLASGALSGFVTAYVQLSTAKDKYSIERAKEFQNLMEKLKSEETSRLAVLNLWQLYPDERDRKIITAAAFAVGQPDLVEIISGIDEELGPVAEILQARALSENTDDSDPALQTLMRIDPVRAARVMINRVNKDIADLGDLIRRPKGSVDPVIALTKLAEENDTIYNVILSEGGRSKTFPVLLDYILYRADRESKFVDRVISSFEEGRDLDKFNGYLARADFRDADSERVVKAVSAFVVAALDGGNEKRYEIMNALVGLKNATLSRALRNESGADFISKLTDAVSDSKKNDLLRARSLALLRKISPNRAINAVADVLKEDDPPPELLETIEEQLRGGLIAQLERQDPEFKRPPHCADDADDEAFASCINNKVAWATWLNGRTGGWWCQDRALGVPEAVGGVVSVSAFRRPSSCSVSQVLRPRRAVRSASFNTDTSATSKARILRSSTNISAIRPPSASASTAARRWCCRSTNAKLSNSRSKSWRLSIFPPARRPKD